MKPHIAREFRRSTSEITIMRKIIALLTLALCSMANAESYREIGPLDSLGDVKARLPSAEVEKLSPAWAQPTDSMYQFSGTGLPGVIIVAFYDARPNQKKILETIDNDSVKTLYKNLSSQSDDDALTVSWVRWIPDEAFPLQRLIAKYGPPEKSAFSNENFQPYRAWKKKGVAAYLTDDEKKVVRIDYSHTKAEQRAAYIKKYNFVPDWLKENTPATKKISR